MSFTEALGGTEMVKSLVFVIISILGTMQTIKGFLQLKDGKWYALIMVVVAAAFSYVFWMTDLTWVRAAIVAWSLSQLCYDALLKTLMKVVDGFGNRLTGEKAS